MAKQNSNLSTFFQVAVILIVAAFLFRLLMPRGAAGGPLPELEVAGWLNGPPPELGGKVVLLDVFATS
jgi:hypothetical protein